MKKTSAVLDANCERRADAIGEAVSRKLLADARQIIDTARANAVRSVDFNRVMMYWNLGRRVFEEEQHGKDRAEYGARIIRGLAERLEPEYGSGFGIRQLEQSRRFYRLYPIAHTLYAQLNWSQYKLLISFVIVELKTGELTHQDLGQLQMYVNYYDRMEKTAEENKTIGILLCRNKNDSLVKMTFPEDNKTILAAEYKLRLPSEEQLLAEVKRAEEEFEAAKDETDARARISGGEK
ncbi:MAG: DUF1016 domain-containing protein [Lentisphaerae bacterium]|nr:DUF1016 domain-containing protein [Lentisphaerota bacterium]